MTPKDRIVGLYEDHAARWDTIRDRTLFERPWLDRFTALLPERGSVLDVGCGMGEPLAKHFIERGFAVTGVDSSASLIAIAAARFPTHQWTVGDMRTMSLDRRFNGLIAWHSFFHLSAADQRPMFARFAAHAQPGAVLMFTSGPAHGEAIGTFEGEPLYHASLDPVEYRSLMIAEGFEVLDYRERDPQVGEATVWLARKTR